LFEQGFHPKTGAHFWETLPSQITMPAIMAAVS